MPQGPLKGILKDTESKEQNSFEILQKTQLNDPYLLRMKKLKEQQQLQMQLALQQQLNNQIDVATSDV